MTCTATTSSGRRCRRPPVGGSDRCHGHSPGAKVGRPSALTPEVHERLVQAKRLGCPDRVAVQNADISETTYYEIVKNGRSQESGPERDLVEALARAEAEAYMRGMLSWHKGMAGDWRAARTFVEHQDRKHASAPRESCAGGSEQGPRRLDTTELTPAQLDYLAGLVDEEER
jgi:hypothetical protein